jgi:hypothetical protein
MSQKILALVSLLLVLLGAPAAVQAQAAPKLEVTLEVSSRDVSSTDLVVLQVLLRNPRESGRVVLRGQPGFSAGGGLSLKVENSAGQVTTIAPTEGGLTLEEARTGSRRVVLGPGNGISVQRPELASDLFAQPGVYKVHVTYASPSPAQGNPDAGVGGEENVQATSNTVEITVR